MFSNNLTSFLRDISKISNSVILRTPETYGKSETNDVHFKFDVAKAGCESDAFGETQIGLFDLSGFLNVLNLFGNNADERDVEVANNCINISNEDSKAVYIMTEPQLLAPFDVDPNQIEKVDEKPTVAEFIMTASDIKKLRAGATAFKELDCIEFKAEDNVEISLSSSGKFAKSSNSYTIKKPCEPSKNFDIIVALETFMKLPLHDYTIYVKYNEARNDYRILLKSITVAGFKMQISVKVA